MGRVPDGLSLRDYVIEEHTTTVCPLCLLQDAQGAWGEGAWVDGLLAVRGGSVWLRRFCPRHGESESLYEEDATLWRARRGWEAAPLNVTPDRPGNCTPFPRGYAEGLPASHGQHTCLLLLNVAQVCDHGCPACYAGAASPSAAPAPGGGASDADWPQLDSVLRTVDEVIRREGGKLGVLMLSGGEPALRPDLPELLDALGGRPITRVMLNTNGLRIASDDELLALLARHRRRVEVYLQFDGLRPSTHRALRGEDLGAMKLAALERLSGARVATTLVAAIARGVNEDEVGALIRLGLDTPYCTGLALQPLFGSGRALPFDPRDRVTPTGILRRLKEQTGGMLSAEDFIPLPCSHRDCCDITYLVRSGRRRWQPVPRLIGRERLKRWLHLVANTVTFEGLSAPALSQVLKGPLRRVFSQQLSAASPQLAADVAALCAKLPRMRLLMGGLRRSLITCCAEAVEAEGEAANQALDELAQRTFRITIKMFMDAHRVHSARLRQCCTHVGTFESEVRRYPFCWRWLIPGLTDFGGGGGA
jgi:hypothetical protein